MPSHGSPHFKQSTKSSPVSLLQTSLYRNSSFAHPWSPHRCNRITESIMPLPTRPLCSFRHYWPWHLDHSSLILVGIHGSVLSWFKSYLSSCCVSNVTLACTHPPAVSPRLCPLLFVMYTTPVNTLTSSCSLNHHLYADDTQLLLPTHFEFSIPSISPSECSKSNFVLDDSLTDDVSHKPGGRLPLYFPSGPQLPSPPLRGLLPISLLGEQRHDGCEQFA